MELNWGLWYKGPKTPSFLNTTFREVYDVFEEIHKVLDMSVVPLDIPSNRILREVAQQSRRNYNTLNVSHVTMVKTSNTLTQIVENS
jgi:predicted nucleic acid-binding OB-fold protein